MSYSIHSDAKNTVRISARRFEPSPDADCYTNPETVHGVYAGRFYSIFNRWRYLSSGSPSPYR